MAPMAAATPSEIKQLYARPTLAECIEAHLDEARDWFKCAETRALITAATPATRQWLEDNKEHYAANLKRTAGAWRGELAPTPDDAKHRARLRGLGYQVYEHGLLNFLERLTENGAVAGALPLKIRVLATDGNTIPVLEQLFMNDGAFLDLAGLARQFGLSDRTAPRKARDCQLIRLTSVGLLIAKTDGRGYSISLGPVAEIFYRDVFAVMLKQFEKDMDGP